MEMFDKKVMQEVLDAVWLKTSHELARKFSNALAATADLKDVRLCHAKPSAWLRDDNKGGSINTMSDSCTDAVKELWLRVNPKNVERYVIPLYRAWEPTK